jgi:hypothetical protein
MRCLCPGLAMIGAVALITTAARCEDSYNLSSWNGRVAFLKDKVASCKNENGGSEKVALFCACTVGAELDARVQQGSMENFQDPRLAEIIHKLASSSVDRTRLSCAQAFGILSATCPPNARRRSSQPATRRRDSVRGHASSVTGAAVTCASTP